MTGRNASARPVSCVGVGDRIILFGGGPAVICSRCRPKASGSVTFAGTVVISVRTPDWSAAPIPPALAWWAHAPAVRSGCQEADRARQFLSPCTQWAPTAIWLTAFCAEWWRSLAAHYRRTPRSPHGTGRATAATRQITDFTGACAPACTPPAAICAAAHPLMATYHPGGRSSARRLVIGVPHPTSGASLSCFWVYCLVRSHDGSAVARWWSALLPRSHPRRDQPVLAQSDCVLDDTRCRPSG
jgi:hypothetical protein